MFVYLLCLFVETVSTTKRNGLIDIDHPNRNSSSSVGESDSNSVGISISGTSSRSSSIKEEIPWLKERKITFYFGRIEYYDDFEA